MKQEDTMTDTDKIIAEDVASLLTDRIGETGTAYVRHGGLYYRAEENNDERYLGAVDDAGTPGSVKAAIEEFFARSMSED